MGNVNIASRMSLPRNVRLANRNPSAVPTTLMTNVARLTTRSESLSEDQIMDLSRTQKAVFLHYGLSDIAKYQVNKALGGTVVPGLLNDRNGILNRRMRPSCSISHDPCLTDSSHIRRVHDACVNLAAGDMIQNLTHVLREHQSGLQIIP